jgi:hypothetical protein
MTAPKYLSNGALLLIPQSPLPRPPGSPGDYPGVRLQGNLTGCSPGESEGSPAKNPDGCGTGSTANGHAGHLPRSAARNRRGSSGGNSAGRSAGCRRNHQASCQAGNFQSNLWNNGADGPADNLRGCRERGRYRSGCTWAGTDPGCVARYQSLENCSLLKKA